MHSPSTYLCLRKGPNGRAEMIRGALDQTGLRPSYECTSAVQLTDHLARKGECANDSLVILEAPASRDLGHPIDHCILNVREILRRKLDESDELRIVTIVDSHWSNRIAKNGKNVLEGPDELINKVLQVKGHVITVDHLTTAEDLEVAFRRMLEDQLQESSSIAAFGAAPQPEIQVESGFIHGLLSTLFQAS